MSDEEKCVGKEPRKIIAKVISQKGYCAIGHKVGDIIEFDHFGVKGDTSASMPYSQCFQSHMP